MSGTIKVYEGSGNVFADLGLPDAEERLTKAGLAFRIAGAIHGARGIFHGLARAYHAASWHHARRTRPRSIIPITTDFRFPRSSRCACWSPAR